MVTGCQHSNASDSEVKPDDALRQVLAISWGDDQSKGATNTYWSYFQLHPE